MLNEADILAVERELCRRSLAEFAKRAWHVLEPSAELQWGWALDAICLHLEAVTTGQIKRLLINVPPGCMKSLLVGVIWPAWEWGARNMPHLRYIGTAHEEGLAIRDSRKCRDLIKSDWYQKLWPIDLAIDLDGKREFGNTDKGFRQARSFTSMTGVRGDRIILDDPLSADSANSAAKLEAVRVTFTETLPTRVSNKDSAIVVVMQRLNEKDTSGVILSMGLPYVHLCLPMRFEPSRRCRTSIGWEDPRTYEGELLFPERFSEHEVKELEKNLGSYAAAGQLQQTPIPRAGGIVPLDWFGRYDVLPEQYESIVHSWDTASKGAEHNDPSVCTVWAVTQNRYYLIDVYRDRIEYPQLKRMAVAMADKYGPHSVLIEDKASGQALLQDLKKETRLPCVAIMPKDDKITRLSRASSTIEAGRVFLPNRAPWLADFEREIALFPNGAHDDQCDSLSQFINWMNTKSAHVAPSIRRL